MKKIFIIILLLGNGYITHCQQMFTKIPVYRPQSGARVYEGLEMDGAYFFGSSNYYAVNGVFYGNYSIHKTDLNGDIIDSVLFSPTRDTDSLDRFTMQVEDDLLCWYRIYGKYDAAKFYAPTFSIIRQRFNSDLDLIDSVAIPIPPSEFKARNWAYLGKYNDKIYAVITGEDTASFSTPIIGDRAFVLDTTGIFLYQNKFSYQGYSMMGFESPNNGNNFITRWYIYDSILSTGGSGLLWMDDSLNNIRSTLELNTYNHVTGAMDLFDERKFTVAYIKDESPAPLDDSICVDLRDTSFNLIKRTCMPRHAIFNGFANIPKHNKTVIYDGHRKNSIFVGADWMNSVGANGHFTISNLDSNLNIRWSKVLGGDFPYLIWNFYSTSDGGCLIMGERFNVNYTEPVIFKISQQGVITNLTSFAPSAQQYFSVYPNPSRGIFHIKNTSGKAYELMIFSQEGKVVSRSTNIKEKDYVIDLSQQAAGIYFYKIFTSEGRSASGKIVRQF